MVALTQTQKELAASGIETVDITVGRAVRYGRIPLSEAEECKSFCNERLCFAAKRYNEDKGCKFTTFAYKQTHWAITDYIRRKYLKKSLNPVSIPEGLDLPSAPKTHGLDSLIEVANLTDIERAVAQSLLLRSPSNTAILLNKTKGHISWVKKKIVRKLKRAAKVRNLTEKDFVSFV